MKQYDVKAEVKMYAIPTIHRPPSMFSISPIAH